MLNRLNLCKLTTVLLALISASTLHAAADNWQMNMYEGVTPLSHDMYYLHMVGMLICTIIGIGVFGVMIYSLIHHRKSKGYKAATFHEHPVLEIIWTIIPFLILVGLAIPATKILMRMDNSSRADVTIKVVGYQWRWQYEYLDKDVSFFSTLSTPYSQIQNKEEKGEWYLLEVDKPLVVPVNKKIRFLVTSNDVVHSWWVPELGIKRDAIPGFMYEAWAKIERPGTYRGQCAELCGINHGFMPIVVEAVSEEDFEKWLVAQKNNQNKTSDTPKKMTRQELMILGKKKYRQLCSACHKADGQGLSPLYPPLKGSSVAVGHPISRHIDLILHGIPGSAMQPYRDELTDEEVAAIVTYERNAWGNNTDEKIQPEEVAKQRKTDIQQPTMVNKAKVGGFQ